MVRFLAGSIAFGLIIATATAAPVPVKKPPMITVQVQPLGKIEADILHFAEAIGGKEMAEKAKAFIDNEWAIFKAVSGIDQKKPFLGYAELDIDFAKSKAVFLLPMASEKAFLEFQKLKKDDPVRFEPIPGNDGLYEFSKEKNFPVRVLMRFVEGYAYFGINMEPKEMDAAKLLPTGDLIRAKETALASVRITPDVLPLASKKTLLENFDRMVDGMVMGVAPQEEKNSALMLEALGKGVKSLSAKALNETESVVLELQADTKTNELGIEFKVVPKKGSTAAKDIATRNPDLGPLAGFMQKECAATFIQSTLGVKEIREMVATAYGDLKTKVTDEKIPESLRPLAIEGIDLFQRSQAAGKANYGASAYGPDKNGKFNFAGFLTCEDPSKLEKMLREVHAKDAPEEYKKEIRLDVAKVGKVAIHEVNVKNLPDAKPEIPEGKACVAFLPHAIYITHGPESLEVMKKLIVAKLEPLRPYEISLNPARFVKLLGLLDAEKAKQAEELLGTEDRLYTGFQLDIVGGETLRIRFAMHTLMMKLFMLLDNKGMAGN